MNSRDDWDDIECIGLINFQKRVSEIKIGMIKYVNINYVNDLSYW